MEIHNIFSFDILVQGLFLTACFVIGCFIVFKDNFEIVDKGSIQDLSQFLSDFIEKTVAIFSFKFPDKEDVKNPRAYSFLGFLPLIIVVSFAVGVMGFAIADEWMDSKQANHLFLKRLWMPEDVAKKDSTLALMRIRMNPEDSLHVFRYKDLIRYRGFESIYRTKLKYEDLKLVSQIFYHGKHEILLIPEYSNYVRKNEILVEYCQTFALGFFLLLVFSFVNLILMITRVLWKEGVILYRNRRTLRVRFRIRLKILARKLALKKSKKIGEPKSLKSSGVTYAVMVLMNLITLFAIYLFISPEFDNLKLGLIGYIATGFLVYFGCLTSLLFFFHGFRKLRFTFFVYSLVYVTSILGYFGSSKAWAANTRSVTMITFGIQKTLHITDNAEEIKYLSKMDLDSFAVKLGTKPIKNDD